MSDFPDMSDAFEIAAPAKTNLWLKVLGKRDDGFHEIDTRMVSLSLNDQLRLKWREDSEVVLRCSDPSLPTGEENLCVKAVRALERKLGKTLAVSIDLEKAIPSGAGLGGGSSDAAAVLKALNEMGGFALSKADLAAVGATIGSDIPFFVYGQTCDCRGRGEVVEPVTDSVPSLPVLLIKLEFGISAAWAYRRFHESAEYEDFLYEAQAGPAGEMVNHLERPVFEKFPVLGLMKNWLLKQEGVEIALLSGSGSTMLAVIEEQEAAEPLVQRIQERYGENCWTYCGHTN